MNNTIKNRGAVSNPTGRFEKTQRSEFDDGWDKYHDDAAILSPLETILIKEPAKSIITYNDSPDIGFDQAINPYRGCEHGCIYCYARPAHGYMNLSSGLDFETKIFYKPEAAQLLQTELAKSSYQCKPIVLGSNTDPYQPVESQQKITRSLLEVLNKTNHPVVIITKSSLIERDLDILQSMAARNLAKVAVSITTLSLALKQIMEPRTATPKARLKVIQTLSSAGIPVRVMAAPMIPMINDFELEKILEFAKKAGASTAGYTLIRLPHEVKDLFKEWLAKHFPERAEHVMSLVKQMRNGKEYDTTFGKRMRGEGQLAQLLAARFQLACKKLGFVDGPNPLSTNQFTPPKPFSKQLDLFD
ncbi:MAG: PA0069 family radical SAM protein [Proteobacteria bacterium]|nr:PA0069 family radical SAM protein [Pseudomonadota bacterium]